MTAHMSNSRATRHGNSANLCGPTAGEVVTVASFGQRPGAILGPGSERTRAVWTAGDFTRIAVAYARGAEEFLRRLDLVKEVTVLDVACGSGNLTLPAAVTGATVTGIDDADQLHR